MLKYASNYQDDILKKLRMYILKHYAIGAMALSESIFFVLEISLFFLQPFHALA
jgi:hypothetical protein